MWRNLNYNFSRKESFSLLYKIKIFLGSVDYLLYLRCLGIPLYKGGYDGFGKQIYNISETRR